MERHNDRKTVFTERQKHEKTIKSTQKASRRISNMNQNELNMNYDKTVRQ